jgi:predicted outer membrane repeat protein
VDSAAEGDTLALADGTYRGDGNRDVTVDVTITIMSESNDPTLCVVDCEGSPAESHRAFYLDYDGSYSIYPEIIGLTVTNGYSGEGGAIKSISNGCLIRNCHFLSNEAGAGGALWVIDIVRVSDCYFADNTAGGGGAVYATFYHTGVTLERCVLERNSAYYGGAVYVFDDWDVGVQVTLRNCTLVANSGYGSAAFSNVFGVHSCGLRQTIVAYGTGGPACVDCGVQCCNFYENQPDPGWLPYGSNNFSACPSFCDLGAGDYRLCDGSPCAPGNHPDGAGCGLIGALDVGCLCGPSASEPTTWGAIKSIYR